MPHRRTVAIPRAGSFPSQEQPFWPAADGNTFRFHLEGVDKVGQVSKWSMPLIFVYDDGAHPESVRAALRMLKGYYDGLPADSPYVRCAMQGQRIAYAPLPPKGDQGSTTLVTAALAFGFGNHRADTRTANARPPGLAAPPRRGDRQDARRGLNVDASDFAPLLDQTQVQVEALAQLTGGNYDKAVVARIADIYKTGGFDAANPGRMFLSFARQQGQDAANAVVGFAANQTGGIATPNLAPIGLSATLGPVGGDVTIDPQEQLTRLARGQFNPADFFKNANPLLLGHIPLDAILPSFDDAVFKDLLTPPDLGDLAPTFKTTIYYQDPAHPDDPTRTLTAPPPTKANPLPRPVAIETAITWAPPRLKPYHPTLPSDDTHTAPYADPNPLFISYPSDASNPFLGPTRLTIDGVIRTDLKGGATSYSMHGELANFSLRLIPGIPVIELQFTGLTFDARTGQKPSFLPKLHDVAFLGALAFVEPLKQFLGGPVGNDTASAAPATAASWTWRPWPAPRPRRMARAGQRGPSSGAVTRYWPPGPPLASSRCARGAPGSRRAACSASAPISRSGRTG